MARGNEPTICVLKLNCDEMSDDVFDRVAMTERKKCWQENCMITEMQNCCHSGIRQKI